MRLSIIILNYNTRDLLDAAIGSLHSKVSHEIIVVDNASTDDSVSFIKSNHQNVKLIVSPQNVGFAAGNNLGIRAAQGDYIMLLNSDTKVQTGALDKLLHFADSHREIGILTPKLILPDGALDLSCHRGFPTLGNSIAYFLGLESIFPNFKPLAQYHQTYQDFATPHPVDVVSGAAMLIRRQVIDQIGLLDERFFMYAEDIDFCLRAKQAGWLTYYYPGAVVVHFKGASGSKSQDPSAKSRTRGHFYTTMHQYFHKHHAAKYPKPARWLVKAGIYIVGKIKG